MAADNIKIVDEVLGGMLHISERTKKGYKSYLQIYAREVGVDIRKATTEDVKRFLVKFKARVKPASLSLMIRTLRTFYKTMERCEVMDKEKIKLPRIKKGLKEYPSADELLKIFDACVTIRDKACIAGLYESGARASEWLHLKIEDVIFKKGTAYIKIWESKTESRQIVIKKFVIVFKLWLNHHPYKNAPGAPLWVRMRPVSIKSLKYAGLYKICSRACEHAGVKMYSPHKFRHRRAKDLEDVLPIRKKMAYFGWSNIQTAGIYGQFSSEEACDDIVAHEEGREIIHADELANWKCTNCETENPPHYNYCGVCSQAKAPHEEIAAINEGGEELIELKETIQKLSKRIEIIEQKGF